MYWLLLLVFFLVIGIIIYVILAGRKEEDRLYQTQQKLNQEDQKTIQPIESQSNIKIVFLAAARNAMEGLPFMLSNLKRIKKAYPLSRLIVIENDSTDGTRQYLETQFPSILPTTIVSPNFKHKYTKTSTTGKGFERIQRMCLLRNQLLSYVSKEDDYVIQLDADWNCCIETTQFQKAISYLDSNQKTIAGCFPLFLHYIKMIPFKDVYFDTYAFVNNEFPNINHDVLQHSKLLFKKWPDNKEIDVDSAFGTLGIYRVSDIYGLEYKPQQDMFGGIECEHVTFNRQVKERSKKSLQLLTWFKMVV